MRLLEIIIPKDSELDTDKHLDSDRVIRQWTYTSKAGESIVKVLIQDDYAKELLSELEDDDGDYRVVIYGVEGTLPRVNESDKEKNSTITVGKFFTISKEELYNDIDEPIDLSANFILMVILSSFVAGIGFLKESVAVVIGAMAIAPFLGPNMSLAFGTTLGDWPMIRKSLTTGAVAIGVAVIISFLWGFFTTDIDVIAREGNIALRDVLLAFACGFAGVISVVSGQGGVLVGVMVAAALLPPLIRAGLLLGGAMFQESLNSFMIFSANIICVNISGIITFYLAGIRPQRWWEKEKAKKHMKRAMIIWGVALAILVVGIIVLRKYTELD